MPNMVDARQQFVRPSQAAKLAGVSLRTVRRRIAKGVLPVSRSPFSNRLLVAVKDIAALYGKQSESVPCAIRAAAAKEELRTRYGF